MNPTAHHQESWSIGKAALLTDLAMCINRYRMHSVGMFACIQASVQLGNHTVYPDFMIMINAGPKKQAEVDFEKNCFIGPPNFILEIFSKDDVGRFQQRKALFETAGVQEYLVMDENLSAIQWNCLRNGKYRLLKSDTKGVLKSEHLPGLWIPLEALKTRNFWNIMAAIDQGVTRKEHHVMMQSIWK